MRETIEPKAYSYAELFELVGELGEALQDVVSELDGDAGTCSLTSRARAIIAIPNPLLTTAPDLLASLIETLRALEAHLDDATRDAGLGHRSDLCPCHDNEVRRAKAAIAKATGKG